MCQGRFYAREPCQVRTCRACIPSLLEALGAFEGHAGIHRADHSASCWRFRDGTANRQVATVSTGPITVQEHTTKRHGCNRDASKEGYQHAPPV